MSCSLICETTCETGQETYPLFDLFPNIIKQSDEHYSQSDTEGVLKKITAVLENIAGITKKDLDGLAELINADTAPQEFLIFLSATLGTLIGTQPVRGEDFQRWLIKNLVNFYKIKGTHRSWGKQFQWILDFWRGGWELWKTTINELNDYDRYQTYDHLIKSARFDFYQLSGETPSWYTPELGKQLLPIIDKIRPIHVLLRKYGEIFNLSDNLGTIEEDFKISITFDFNETKTGFTDSLKVDGCLTSCQLACQFECQNTCQGSCEDTCQGSCEDTCQGSCENTCQGTCEGTCEADCEGTCQGTCEGTCEGSCEDTCQTYCEGTCQGGCEGACEDTCQGTCQSYCEGACEGAACEYACQAACESEACEGACQGGCQTSSEDECLAACQSQCEAGSCESGCQVGSCQSGCQGCAETEIFYALFKGWGTNDIPKARIFYPKTTFTPDPSDNYWITPDTIAAYRELKCQKIGKKSEFIDNTTIGLKEDKWLQVKCNVGDEKTEQHSTKGDGSRIYWKGTFGWPPHVCGVKITATSDPVEATTNNTYLRAEDRKIEVTSADTLFAPGDKIRIESPGKGENAIIASVKTNSATLKCPLKYNHKTSIGDPNPIVTMESEILTAHVVSMGTPDSTKWIGYLEGDVDPNKDGNRESKVNFRSLTPADGSGSDCTFEVYFRKPPRKNSVIDLTYVPEYRCEYSIIEPVQFTDVSISPDFSDEKSETYGNLGITKPDTVEINPWEKKGRVKGGNNTGIVSGPGSELWYDGTNWVITDNPTDNGVFKWWDNDNKMWVYSDAPEDNNVFPYWDGNKYIFSDPLEEITVITAFQVDTVNKKLQIKTRTVKVIPTADESGWTDVHTGTECPE